MLLRKMLLGVTVIGFACFLSACTKDPYLYDRAGFEAGARPKNVQANSSSPTKVVPDYYYRQQSPNQAAYQQQPQQYSQPPQQYIPQGYQPQQQYSAQPYQYQQQPSYYPPQGYGGQQPVQGYQQPSSGGSRFYSNPYAIPPTSEYPYYDADQYYVPPSYSTNNEYQSAPRPDMKY